MMYQIFKEALAQSPDAIALINSEGKQWTYRELDQTVQRWALYLHDLDIRPEDRVAVRLKCEDLHVIIFLALSRLNASYIPFDDDIPEQQFIQDIKRLEVKRCLRDDDFSDESLESIAQYPTTNDETGVPVSGLISYWVSSSGTTGEKKWIPILSEGLNYWAKQLRTLMQLKKNEKVLATRSPGFDARIFEYLEAFASGSTLCLIDRKQRKDFQAILKVCEEQRITSLLFIASQFGQESLDDLLHRFKQAGLKHLLVTGDACTPHLKRFCERYGILLWNCYGPTEATFGYSMLCVNGLSLWSDGRQSIVPIGKAGSEEVRYHLINEKLYIESPYLTPGYLNPIDDDRYFMVMSTEDGNIRLFDTQDRVIARDGYLYYQGRWNHESHCKVNGVKITTDFIESCINDYNRYNPLIKIQAAVVIKPYLDYAKPFAYVVVSDHFDKSAFHEYLKAHLVPEEMPNIIPLASLPQQTSDKIDKFALIQRDDDLDAWFRDPLIESSHSLDTCVDKVRNIWKQVLQRKTIPDDVEFIFLGGTSITAMELTHKIQTLLDSTFTYQTFLQLSRRTVQTIAERLYDKTPINDHTQPEMALIQPLLDKSHVPNQSSLFFLPALLGEGYFSYRALAESMSHHLAQPMHGLSDPGILNDEWLPTDMDHAVIRYIAAIKRVQPEGPYELLGFSFGATLAYEVAKRLISQGDVVKKLHLIDAFPPMIFQALNVQDKASLLQALMHFLLPIFNNGFYGEHLNPAHVESGFSRLRMQLKNPQSHRLLSIAQRHLEWMQTMAIPDRPLALCPVLYFTKRDQTYLNIVNQIGVSRMSADYRFYGWNRYFTDVRRSGIELQCEHLGALKAEYNPQQYWQRAHDGMFNLSFDYYGPNTSYQWRQEDNHWILSVFFLNSAQASRLEKQLQHWELEPTVYAHEKKIEKYQQKDYLIYRIETLVCTIPNAMKEVVTIELEKTGYDHIPDEVGSRHITSSLRKEASAQAIDLHLIYGSTIYMTLTFYIDIAPSIVIQALHQQLHYPKSPKVLEQHLMYFLHLTCVETLKAIEHARNDIVKFISVLQPVLQTATTLHHSYPKQSTFFQPSPLDNLCKKYKLPDKSSASLEKGLRNAANNNQLADIKLFLEADIDINAQDEKQHKTALYWATNKRWNDCAEYLRAHGASL